MSDSLLCEPDTFVIAACSNNVRTIAATTAGKGESMAFGKSGARLAVLRLEDRVTPSSASAVVPVRHPVPPPTAQAAASSMSARATTTELTGPTSATERQSVTFTAKVRAVGSSTFPTGTVTFRDGSTVLGTVNLQYDKATVTTSSLSPGLHRVTATYNATAAYSTSSSSAVTVNVTGLRFATTTVLATSSATPTAGQSVTLTATVRAVGDNRFPTGTVTFRDRTTVLGTADLRYDKAVLTTAALAAGSHSITATYNATANYSASNSSAVSVNVAPRTYATTTSLSASSTAPTAGQSVTLTATVRAVGDTRFPTGTVTFKSGSTVIGTANLRYDKATLTTAALGAGLHPITAVYNGTTTYRTSTSTAVSLNVTRPRTATTTTLTGPGAVSRGQSAAFVATVRGASGTATPSGTVTFRVGTTVLGTVALSGGRASYSTSQLAVATHGVTATYNPTGVFSGSTSSVLTVRVSNASAASRTAVSVSRGASTYGDAVTFTARISPASGTGTPTGTVTFRDGTVILGTKTLSGGAATLTIHTLRAGSHTITASYSGDSRYTTSSGTASRLTVGKATALADVIVTPTTLPVSGSISVRVNVHGVNSSTIPSGRVTFRKGSLVLGAANLDRDGNAAFTFPASRVGRGQFLISGFYEGSDGFNADGGSDLVTIH